MDLGPSYCRGTWSNNCFSKNHWNPWSECKMDDNSNQRLKWFEVVILWEVRILIKHCWASRSYIKQGLFANTFKFRLLKNHSTTFNFPALVGPENSQNLLTFIRNSRMGHWDWFTASLPRRWIELACLHWQKHCSYPGLWWGVTPGSSCHFFVLKVLFFFSKLLMAVGKIQWDQMVFFKFPKTSPFRWY